MGRIIYTAEAAPFASGDALETFESRDFRVASGGVCWIIRDNRHISCELFVKTLEYSDCTTVANFRNSLQSIPNHCLVSRLTKKHFLLAAVETSYSL